MSSPIVLHLLYGGVGGHRSVVRAILDHDRETAYSVLLLDTSEAASDDEAWGIPVHRVTIRHRGDLGSMVEVFRIVRTQGPAVAMCHSHRHILAVFLGMLAARRSPRIVLVEHQPNRLRSWNDGLWSAIGILLSKSVVFLTPEHTSGYPLGWLLRLRRARSVLIPNGVAATSLAQSRTGAASDVFTFGVAGRLIPHKDVSSILRAMAALPSEVNGIRSRFLIAGDGDSRLALEAEALALGIDDRVDFLGALPADRMPAFFDSLDVYVHSSLGETLSMSILEAAAMGLPIVASDTPGIRDLLTHEVDALLVPPSDPSALADALERLHDPELRRRLGNTAHEMVQHRFPPHVTAEGYRRLVLELIGGRR